MAGYHEHFVRRPSDDALLAHINVIHAETHGGYGWREHGRTMCAWTKGAAPGSGSAAEFGRFMRDEHDLGTLIKDAGIVMQ